MEVFEFYLKSNKREGVETLSLANVAYFHPFGFNLKCLT